jgi:hypothetical protein
MLAATQAKNKQLKEVINTHMQELKYCVSNLGQHGRSFSIRDNNLLLDSAEEKDPPAIIKKVYNTVFLPNLQEAASKQVMSQVPSCYEMMEMAHLLPGKNDRPKPIIIRVFNRNLKAILFKHRNEFTPTIKDGSGTRYRYPFNNDLSCNTFLKMKQLQGDPCFYSCWFTGGASCHKAGCKALIRSLLLRVGWCCKQRHFEHY